MQRPSPLPIGLHLAATARSLRRAFDERLAAGGGSLPVWLVLLNVKINGSIKQRELAAAVGVSEATLSHHLDALEADGAVIRRRDPANRRVQLVELTDTGEQRFLRLRATALGFDAQLRRGFTPEEQATLSALLDRLADNVANPTGNEPPWKELIE